MILKPGSRPVPNHPSYELVCKIGRGAFGEVWRSRAPGGIDVALKFIALNSSAHAATEFRSVDVMRSARHPNLVSLYGAWYEDGYLILAMELCDRSLQDRLAEAQSQKLPGIPMDELLGYMRDAANGLDALVALDVHHRDVKPANLLLLGSGVKVGDFGLAKVREHTAGNTVAGTLAYIAPECYEGKLADQSDQYSLAVTYYYLRTGHPLYEGHEAAVMRAKLMAEPDLSRLPRAEAAVLARALAREPGKRWPSCTAFVNEMIGRHGKDNSRLTPSPSQNVDEPRNVGLADPPKRYSNSFGLEFLSIPAATFWMGERGKQKQVEIPHPFYIGVYPVTQWYWRLLMGNNPSWFSRTGGGAKKVRGFFGIGGIPDIELQQLPVECVSCGDGGEFDVEKFIANLNSFDSNREWVYRLPTEAEWEYACRGGATSQAECAFDFYFDHASNYASLSQANFDGHKPSGSVSKGPCLGRTTKVGSYKPNQLGLFDMHGNVGERCLSTPKSGFSAEVFRGGGWNYRGYDCRAAARFCVPDRSSRLDYLGFRLVRVRSSD